MSSLQQKAFSNSLTVAEARAAGLLDLWRRNRNKGTSKRSRKPINTSKAHMAQRQMLEAGEVIVVALPWSPSVNHYYVRSQHGVHISKTGREYVRHVSQIILSQRLAGRIGDALVDVAVILHAPDNNMTHDVDNYTKAMFDALSKAGFWVDDKQVVFAQIYMGNRVAGGAVELAVRLHQRKDNVSARALLEVGDVA